MNQYLTRIYQALFGLVWRNYPLARPQEISGKDAFYRLPYLLIQAGKHNPLIVTGKRIATGDEFATISQDISHYVLFDQVESDPSIATALKIAKAYTDNNCDSIVAIGGGSYMDAAKAAAAHIANPKKSLYRMNGILKVRKKTPYFIAVPTTAGTGSEATITSVVINEKNQRKVTINDPVLVPDVAILDPSLTLSLPASLTAQTGMDALTHAVEAFLNKPYLTADTTQLCLDAVRDIVQNLPKAYKDPLDLDARSAMLNASCTAGKAFTVACVGYVHGLAHAIGARYHMPHGLTIAILLPTILERYGKAVEQPLAELARYAGIAEGSDSICCQAFIALIRQMNKAMGIPEGIEALKEEDFKQLASYCYQEVVPLYPVPVIFSEKELVEILRNVKEMGVS
ncbi:MAG: iron-containing alcohol dehydrogenase [Lachnospiraceae bacterium]|nr:iron-containing alcohol dehydrogenase [Lachnospiraceae bacterium]